MKITYQIVLIVFHNGKLIWQIKIIFLRIQNQMGNYFWAVNKKKTQPGYEWNKANLRDLKAATGL